MPGRRGGGRGCRVRRFMVPCLLVMLHREPAHGYSLLNGLDEFGFHVAALDPSLVYRTLRDMEAAGLVESEWGDESLGPQRRNYAITSLGSKHLDQWVTDLRRTQNEIGKLLAAYEKILEKPA